MTQTTVAQLLEKAPDAQFVGGVVILHVASANVEIGKQLPDSVVELTAAGEELLESVAAPEKKTRKRKVAEAQLDLPLDAPADVVEASAEVVEPSVDPVDQ